MTRLATARRGGRRRCAPALLLACSAIACGPALPKDDLAEYVEMRGSNLSRLIADPRRPYVYVSDVATNEVHFFDTATHRIERSLWVGSKPGAMDLKPDGSVLFVALEGASSVAVVDLSTQEPLAAIGVPGTPGELAVAADQRLYVSVRGGAIAVFDVSRLPVASEGTVSTSPWGTVLAGRTADRHRIFTHDATTSLGLTEWDASVAPATQVLTADVCSGPPLVSSSADSATFAFVGAGWPLDGGDVPIFRTADMLRAATLNVEWNPSAVAMCPVTGRVAVAHEDVQVNPTTTAPHHQGTGDLHTFDGRTYVETTRYRLRSHVRPAGIACGPDGSIYLILGADAGTAIGVVAP